MNGLVDLYQRPDVHAHDWHDFGPKWDEMTWHYHTFAESMINAPSLYGPILTKTPNSTANTRSASIVPH